PLRPTCTWCCTGTAAPQPMWPAPHRPKRPRRRRAHPMRRTTTRATSRRADRSASSRRPRPTRIGWAGRTPTSPSQTSQTSPRRSRTMRTLRLARAEITRHKGFLPTLAVLFLVIVPCLYGALYLWSNWDPYGTLEDVPVAVVNLDEPVTVEGTEVAAGDELVD